MAAYFYPPTQASTGGATEATQLQVLTQVTAINANTTGSATAAKQDSQITLEGAIANNTGNTATNTAQLADATHVTASTTGQPARVVLVAGTDGVDTYPLATDGSGNLKVSVQDSALPTGAATAANQATEITSLASIATATYNTELQTGATAASTSSIDATIFSRLAGSLTPVAYDEIVQAYVGATTDLDTVTYKLGGSTVKTLTFSYDGSNRLTGVVAS